MAQEVLTLLPLGARADRAQPGSPHASRRHYATLLGETHSRVSYSARFPMDAERREWNLRYVGASDKTRRRSRFGLAGWLSDR